MQTENLIKQHHIINDHQRDVLVFDPQLVCRLIKKITIILRYMDSTFKDGKVIKVKM